MNLILFEAAEIDRPLPRDDRRARHILDVLRRQPGDTFDAGIINGPRGRATLTAITTAALNFTFAADAPLPAMAPITLLVGLPRPQTARDILRDATSLGVAAIHFVRTDKSESSYAQSTLWSNGEWRRHALAGAEQAFDTRLPEITHGRSLTDLLSALTATTAPASASTRIALDNYESPGPLSQIPNITSCATLAIGAERGWSAEERGLLRRHGFSFAHLGSRVLRTETACIAALAIIRAKMALM